MRTKFQYLRFYYYNWVDTSTGGLLAPEGVIRPVIRIVTLFIRYIYNWNLQFINNEIINKTKDLLPQAYVTWAEFGYPA